MRLLFRECECPLVLLSLRYHEGRFHCASGEAFIDRRVMRLTSRRNFTAREASEKQLLMCFHTFGFNPSSKRCTGAGGILLFFYFFIFFFTLI